MWAALRNRLKGKSLHFMVLTLLIYGGIQIVQEPMITQICYYVVGAMLMYWIPEGDTENA